MFPHMEYQNKSFQSLNSQSQCESWLLDVPSKDYTLYILICVITWFLQTRIQWKNVTKKNPQLHNRIVVECYSMEVNPSTFTFLSRTKCVYECKCVCVCGPHANNARGQKRGISTDLDVFLDTSGGTGREDILQRCVNVYREPQNRFHFECVWHKAAKGSKSQPCCQPEASPGQRARRFTAFLSVELCDHELQ